MEPLTDKQSNVLAFIREALDTDGRPPTVREIAWRFRFASTNAARRHLGALERKGYIERSARRSRGIALAQELRTPAGLPIVGRVAAGTPITAVENLDGYLSIDSLFPSGADLFCLRVRGDSMVDAGIWDGDYVIVRRKPDFENGETGVAVVDGEATVKRIRRNDRFVELVPANQNYETIRVDLAQNEFRYAGEVVGIHRVL
ncbi:MAG: transcriptional repressor LexA [Planctomycetota bacterium]